MPRHPRKQTALQELAEQRRALEAETYARERAIPNTLAVWRWINGQAIDELQRLAPVADRAGGCGTVLLEPTWRNGEPADGFRTGTWMVSFDRYDSRPALLLTHRTHASAGSQKLVKSPRMLVETLPACVLKRLVNQLGLVEPSVNERR